MEPSEVKVVYEPPKTVVVHGIMKVNITMLLDVASMGVEAGGIARPLGVIDDFVFSFAELPMAEPMITRFLGGTMDIIQVIYARDQEFVSSNAGFVENKVSKVKIPLVRQESSAQLVAVVDFLRTREEASPA